MQNQWVLIIWSITATMCVLCCASLKVSCHALQLLPMIKEKSAAAITYPCHSSCRHLSLQLQTGLTSSSDVDVLKERRQGRQIDKQQKHMKSNGKKNAFPCPSNCFEKDAKESKGKGCLLDDDKSIKTGLWYIWSILMPP